MLQHLYGSFACEGRYVFIDKSRCSTLLQKRLAVDTVIQRDGGRSVCLEEKIVRWKDGRTLTRLFLETQSCTVPGHESPGWMEYGEADYLVYCFECGDGSLDCYIIDFARLRHWFWQRADHYHRFVMPHTSNKTAGRLVPVADVVSDVGAHRWRVTEEGEVEKLDERVPRDFLEDDPYLAFARTVGEGLQS